MPKSAVKTTWVTKDEKVEVEACELLYALLVADSVGAATATIRDGHNTGGKVKATIGAATSTMGPLDPKEPIPFEQGIYIDVGDNVTGVLVQTRRL